ncbi:uncharacterized protein IL334_002668 [Kwoniella shivajii]|uniref:UvrD-like helicase C-terminal domain-containing protein n=1 Tax=Kwoniella shivajii TaxID=564305 RepID=A0ABZ1CX32_9TREE|nr:hypothetical protein IL334_002668 [Kwoniella shivajii]
MTPLAFFLQTSMLSTDTEGEQDDKDKPKVTITTVHAAKGLEWPVVFIPAVEQGTYPSYRCTEAHEIAEERRLLYVAMTRAQNFLTMSYCQFRMMGGEENDKEASEFVGMVNRHQPGMLSTNLPDIDLAVRRYTSTMLGRPHPDEDGAKEMIMRHVRAAPPLSTWDAPEPRDKWSNRFARREVTKATRAAEYWASESDEYALPGNAKSDGNGENPYAASMVSGFTSARMGLNSKSKQPSKSNSTRNEKPIKEVIKIKSANKNIPDLLPFTFGQPDPIRSDADLGSFQKGGNAALAFMATLGLPPDSAPSPSSSSAGGTAIGIGSRGHKGSSPFMGNGNGTGNGNGNNSSPILGNSPSLLPSRLPIVPGSGSGSNLSSSSRERGAGSIALGGNSTNSNGLNRGTKRLGMGRPAPWGAKRPREG